MFHLNALLGSFARRSAWHRALHVASTAAVDAVGARATWAALPSDGWQRAIDAMEPAWDHVGVDVDLWRLAQGGIFANCSIMLIMLTMLT